MSISKVRGCVTVPLPPNLFLHQGCCRRFFWERHWPLCSLFHFSPRLRVEQAEKLQLHRTRPQPKMRFFSCRSPLFAHIKTPLKRTFHFPLRRPLRIQRLWFLSPRSRSILATSTCCSLKITSWLSPPSVPSAAAWNRCQEPVLVSPA